MRRYLLDSGILGDYVNLRRDVYPRVRKRAEAGNRIGTGMPVMGEMLYGIEYGKNSDANRKEFKRMMENIVRWPFTEAAAEEYGRIAAHLKRTGRPMQVPDIQIAAIAKTLGKCTVVTTDSDLSAIPGLDVENWAVPATLSSPGT